MKKAMIVLFLALTQMAFAGEGSSTSSANHHLKTLIRSVIPTSFNAHTGPFSQVGDNFAPNGDYRRFADSYVATTRVTPVDANNNEQGEVVNLTPDGESEVTVSANKVLLGFRVQLKSGPALSDYFRITTYDGDKVVQDDILKFANGYMDAGVLEVQL